jgi:hypothetical protein
LVSIVSTPTHTVGKHALLTGRFAAFRLRILGGGFGSYSKAYGLAAASLIEAEVVSADGDVKIANACSNPELFWALKGGGSGFGVVTRVTLRTQDRPDVIGAFHLDPVAEIRGGRGGARAGNRRAPYSARAGGCRLLRAGEPWAPTGALAPGAVDRSVSVVVVVMIGVIGVAAMVASVIGHGISDYPSHDRADRAADNSPGDRAPD